jgi:hypothetical protein
MSALTKCKARRKDRQLSLPINGAVGLVLVAAVMSGCNGGSGPEEESMTTSPIRITQDGEQASLGTTVTNVAVSGRVFFDDWRDYGRFSLRKDKNGNPGVQHTMDGDSFNANYLGLRDAKISVYEVDNNFRVGDDCAATTLLGTTGVNDDGSFALTLPTVFDGCGSDNDEPDTVSLAVRVSLEHCDDVRCFEVVPADSLSAWNLWLTGASNVGPAVAVSGSRVHLVDTYFRDTTTLQNQDDIRAEAAIAFAGLVDVTRRFHVDNAWPGHVADYGQVVLEFPTNVDTGVTSGTSSIKMKQGQNKRGWTAMHEYGHIIDHRITDCSADSWGPNDLSPCGVNNCDSWGRGGEKEYKAKAYKEGFADFVVHVTLEGLDSTEAPKLSRLSCGNSHYDGNASFSDPQDEDPDWSNDQNSFARRYIFGCTADGACEDGAAYPTNVARALCDWYDDQKDDDTQLAGAGDTLSHSLEAIHDNLVATYNAIGASQLQVSGITICDMVAQHLTENSNRTAHIDVLRNNGFDCDL